MVSSWGIRNASGSMILDKAKTINILLYPHLLTTNLTNIRPNTMAEKVTISRISFFNKDRDGKDLVNKQGKPYTRCLIDTTDGRTMSGFKNQTTETWNEGDEVTVEVTEREYNGQTYYNFNTPKTGGKDLELHSKVDEILEWVRSQSSAKKPATGQNTANENVSEDIMNDPNNIPF